LVIYVNIFVNDYGYFISRFGTEGEKTRPPGISINRSNITTMNRSLGGLTMNPGSGGASRQTGKISGRSLGMMTTVDYSCDSGR